MRKFTCPAALLLSVLLASAAPAQTLTSTISGINPRQLTFTPVDTSKVIATPPQVMQPAGGFSLLRFIPRFTIPTFFTSPTIGTSAYPLPSSFPSTHYKSPFQPLPPFTPGQ